MSSGTGDVSKSDKRDPIEGSEAHVVQNHSPRLDDSADEPEVVSESDGDEDVFFRPRPSLPAPNVVKRTLRELNELMNTPYLDLDSSEHQPRRRQENDALIGIIDSLSQNYEFPPIFFNQKQVRGPDGSIQYNRVCIDGLKRLSAIKAFLNGEISCHDYRRRKWFYCGDSKDPESSAARKKRVLPMEDKEDFQNKFFICHEFEDLTGPEELELRARVHLGNTLTPGEKLRATMVFSGELMIDFAKALENEFQQIADLADTSGMKGFQNLMKCSSQIFEMLRAGAENRAPQLRISESALIDFVKHADAATLEKIKETLRIFDVLVTRHTEVFSPVSGIPFRPMEMIVIAVLAFKYCQTNIKPLVFIRLIKSLRESIHNFSDHRGVFQTRQSWTHAWDFIQNTEKFIVQGEHLDHRQELDQITRAGKVKSAISEDIPAANVNQNIGSPALSAPMSYANFYPEARRSASSSSFPQHSTALKRKASPHPLDPAKKRVQLPTPVSPIIVQSPRASLRAGSPDSLLGSEGSEEDEFVAESSAFATQKNPPAQSDLPVSAPRQLVRSSFKSRSEFVPHRSESPRPKSSALNTLIASVPAPQSSSKAASSSSPSGLNILFGVSQKPATKPPLPYSHETKQTIPYQSSGALSSEENLSQSGSRHSTPGGQGHPVDHETPAIPPYSGRGRPRKYPPKSVTPERQIPKRRGRPRKESNITVPSTNQIQAHAARGRGRGRKSMPGGFSTRVMPTSHPALGLDVPSPMLQPRGDWEVSMEKTNTPEHSVSPVHSPPRTIARLAGRPRKDLIPSSSPSAEFPPPDLQAKQGADPIDNEKPCENHTDDTSDVRVLGPDQTPEPGSNDTIIPLPNVASGRGQDKPKEAQPLEAPAKSSHALHPPRRPTPPVLVSPAQIVLQSQAISIASSREGSISRLSTVGSLSTMSPRTTPDPSLTDAKPFIIPFKAGGANAIRERRRQQQAELEEKKRRKQEAEKLANASIHSGSSKV
ncbi:hypothetical protein FKW77_003534 [Venturia effusa]|uniref:DUF262 domain-containing protein n=1 Tax=Venturia effusa TaxID=50376 RepID=A0A517L304_9PEZI|nr:hypothetical protein FKW77_003534 [Venturia effusa]